MAEGHPDLDTNNMKIRLSSSQPYWSLIGS